MMKKNLLLILFIILLLGIGTLLLVNRSDSHIAKDNPGSHKKEEAEKALQLEKDTAHNKHKNEDEEQTGDAAQDLFKGKAINVLKSTADYFANQKTHVVAVGDSLTQGVGDSTKEGGYVGVLDKALNQENHLVDFDNFGHHGDRTDQLLKRLQDPKVSTAIADADIVLITIGANDIMKVLKNNITNLTFQKFKEERVYYEGRLRDIFSEINDINEDAEIYLIGFYNPYDQYFKDIKELGLIVNDWNSTGESITEELDNVTYIPTKDLFDNPRQELFAEDNFHPNDLGYRKMAKRILQYLTKQER